MLRRSGVRSSLAALGAAVYLTAAASAQTLQSPHYQFEETDIGGGGLVQSNSANYQASSSLGASAVGDMASNAYQTQAGPRTTNDPSLGFVADAAASNFGFFSPTLTSTATSTFTVLNYTSYGYIVQITGTTPANNGHALPGMATTGPPETGKEQFGINLVANTTPAAFGADPDHGQFGYGSPAPNYTTPNQFRYVSGDTIAIGPRSSGVTRYTISYIANVASLTPGGQYSSSQTLVCVATF